MQIYYSCKNNYNKYKNLLIISLLQLWKLIIMKLISYKNKAELFNYFLLHLSILKSGLILMSIIIKTF